MERHHQSVALTATDQIGHKAEVSGRTARSEWQPRRVAPLTRRYEVAFLTPDGAIDSFTRVAPALPVFEEAFSAFGRGALIATEFGAVAVEDLQPGIRIETATNGFQPLEWIGSMTLYPGNGEARSSEPARLIRIATEAFGPDRPLPDLVIGSPARLLYRNPGCLSAYGTAQAFVPADAFVDSLSVIQVTPVAPVRVFHLGLAGQQVVKANGLEIESFHPGPQIQSRMDRNTLALYLSLFPHTEGREGFGTLEIPRLSREEFEALHDT